MYAAKHAARTPVLKIGSLNEAGLDKWPFPNNSIMPDIYFGDASAVITTDRNGMIWFYNGGQYLYNFTDRSQSIEGGSQVDPTQSIVLDFRTEVVFGQQDKYPTTLEQYFSLTDRFLNISSPMVDSLDRVWFYSQEQGLSVEGRGDLKIFGKIPDDQESKYVKGILLLNDGRVWLGGDGFIWEWKQGRWGRMSIIGTDQTFKFFTQNTQGTVYAATDEGVYQLDGNSFDATLFVEKGSQLLVVPEDGKLENGGACSYHRRYSVVGNCPGYWRTASGNETFKAVYFGAQPDGSVIYVNNRIVARLKDSVWKSFGFDTMTINSATVDQDGNIWILSSPEGLIRLAANIFDDYQSLIIPSSN